MKFHDAPGTPLAPSDDQASTGEMGGRLAQGMHRSRSDTMLWSIENGQTPFWKHIQYKYNGLIHPSLSCTIYCSPSSNLRSSSDHPTAAHVASARPSYLCLHASHIDRRMLWLALRGIRGVLS